MAKKTVLELLDEGKIKRFFRVNQRIIVENGIYHIIQRAPGTERIFIEDNDYLSFIVLLKETISKFKLKVFSFALLPNHLHLLVQISDKNLSEAMQDLFAKYAMFFNKKYQRKGHVFGGKYRPIFCNDETYLLVVSAYIHLNPIKAGLCSEIAKYRWTSVFPYMQAITKDTFIDYKFILFMFDEDINEAREKYKDFLLQCFNVPYSNIVENKNATDEFLINVFDFVKKQLNKVVGMNKDITFFEKELELISDKKRLSQLKDKRARTYLIKQLRARGYSIVDIAKTLNISRGTIYRYLQ